MGVVKQIDIKNRAYYFHHDIIDLKNFDARLLKIDKKHYKGIDVYYIGYITVNKVDDCKYIYSVIPLCLLIDHASGKKKKKNGNKYLIFDSTDENKELLKNYNDVWNGIKDRIKEINTGKCDYEKDYMKSKFNFDNNLPLNKPLKFNNMTIIIRCVFSVDVKLYPQVFLDDILYELNA